MKALDKKLFRELWKLRGPAAAIGLVLACGIATFVMAYSTLDALLLTQETFYRDTRFADAFVSLKRAPESQRERLEAIPGVDVAETRVKAYVKLEVEGFDDPITGELISLPDDREPRLCNVYLRDGRLPEPYSEDEVVVSDGFADAHNLGPGDRVTAVINGRREQLNIVGVVLSSEYIYQIAPGGMFPDFLRFGVFWMSRSALSAAYNMEGAFNDVAFGLEAGANEDRVLAAIDAIVKPYGGLGSYARENQLSHRYLSEEMKQLDQMATIWPILFLGVAAFLLNVVVQRLVRTQREEIAVLKAFGYDNVAVGIHYLKLIFLIVLLGAIGGIAFGVWSGYAMAQMYMLFYRFPYMLYELKPIVVVIAIGVGMITAAVGTVFAVRDASRLSPAVAMRPAPPARYRRSIVERLGIGRFVSQPGRMIIRNLERTPGKSLLSIAGISLACAILVAGMFFGDAIVYMMDVQFGLIQREDIAVSMTEPTSERAIFELSNLPGVQRVEGFRAVPVRLRKDQRSYRTSIIGLDPDPELGRVLDVNLNPIELSGSGLVITEYLGKFLELGPGDTVFVEVLEGARTERTTQVSRIVRQFIGQGTYMRRADLNRLLQEGQAINGAYMAIDGSLQEEIEDDLQERPGVAGTALTRQEKDNFFDTFGENMMTFAFVMVIFAGAIAFGVVYNSARISLAERGRELASLRVLGFTRAEAAFIILGELAVLTLLAIPPGFVLGWAFCASMIEAFQNDLFYFPLIIDNSSYAFAAATVVGSAFLSGLIVRRRINRLDLVEVLKTKE